MISVSIIVITYNSKDTLRECLEAIFLQEGKINYDVILVDAGSNDGTLNIAKQFPVKIIVEKGCTRGHARNIAIEQAKGDVFAMVDSDIIIPRNWLKKLVSYFEDPSIKAVSGPYYTPMPKGLGFIGKVIYYVTSGWVAYRKGVMI